MLIFESPNCSICGCNGNSLVLTLEHEYGIRKCDKCSFVFLSPRPIESSMHEIYSSETYYSGDGSGYSSYDEQEKSLLMTYKKLLKKLNTLDLEKGNLLEIGCGYGYFLDLASAEFASARGTELAPHAIQIAQDKGHGVEKSTLSDLETNERFDLIANIQVLEHLYDPIDSLKKMQSLLRPNGLILTVTPNYNSVLRTLLGKKWPSYKIPEHINYFTKATLEKAHIEAGSSKIKWINYPHAFPLSLVNQILPMNTRISSHLQNHNVWIPGTSIACIAKFD